jgi:hypothetical protein
MGLLAFISRFTTRFAPSAWSKSHKSKKHGLGILATQQSSRYVKRGAIYFEKYI